MPDSRRLAGDLLVEVHDAVLDVRDENQHVGVLHGDLDLIGDPAVPDVDLAAFARQHPEPARVDELKAADAARKRRHDAVAGHAGHLMHDRNPPSDDRVEQRRLPDVRAADDRDGRQRGAFFSFRS